MSEAPPFTAEPEYLLAGTKAYAMFQLAAQPGFWSLDWRKRKRLMRKAALNARTDTPPPQSSPAAPQREP